MTQNKSCNRAQNIFFNHKNGCEKPSEIYSIQTGSNKDTESNERDSILFFFSTIYLLFIKIFYTYEVSRYLWSAVNKYLETLFFFFKWAPNLGSRIDRTVCVKWCNEGECWVVWENWGRAIKSKFTGSRKVGFRKEVSSKHRPKTTETIKGDVGSLEIEHLEGSKTGTGKHMEKRKGDKFRKQLSGKLEWLKCTLQEV